MIQTTVVRIFDETHIVLGAGAMDGVKEGMEFVIYQLSDKIYHPQTGEDLGQLELVKGRVQATHVQERICHARTTSRTITKTVDPIIDIARMMAPLSVSRHEIQVTQFDKLEVEGAVAVKADLKVRVGDPARTLS